MNLDSHLLVDPTAGTRVGNTMGVAQEPAGLNCRDMYKQLLLKNEVNEMNWVFFFLFSQVYPRVHYSIELLKVISFKQVID